MSEVSIWGEPCRVDVEINRVGPLIQEGGKARACRAGRFWVQGELWSPDCR